MSLDIVIADDAALFRDLIAGLLTDRIGATVRALPDAAQLLAAVAVRRPDVAVIDIRLPPSFRTEGLDAAVQLRATDPDLAVIVLSQHLESRHLDRLLRPGAGGFGYLLKDRVTSLDAFLDAVVRIAGGGTVVDPAIVDANLRRTEAGTVLARLSPREFQILRLIALGRSNAAILAELGVSPKTLETQIRSIFNRLDLPADLDAHRRVLATLTYLRRPR